MVLVHDCVLRWLVMCGAKTAFAGVNRVTEVVASPVKPPEASTLSLAMIGVALHVDGQVPDATGAEAAVMAAGLSLGLQKNIPSRAKADNRQACRCSMPTASSF